MSTPKKAQRYGSHSEQPLNESQIMLDHATIRSPMTGTIIDKRVEVGDTVSPGQVMLTLFDPTHMQMVASVSESLAMTLKHVARKLGGHHGTVFRWPGSRTQPGEAL